MKTSCAGAQTGTWPYRHDFSFSAWARTAIRLRSFRDTEALKVTDRWVVANFVPKFNTHRVTLTYPIINAARHVCFLVNSKGKDAILAEVFSGRRTTHAQRFARPKATSPGFLEYECITSHKRIPPAHLWGGWYSRAVFEPRARQAHAGPRALLRRSKRHYQGTFRRLASA